MAKFFSIALLLASAALLYYFALRRSRASLAAENLSGEAAAAKRGPFVKINTSNEGKLKEYKRLFAKHGIDLIPTAIDLEEIDADPETVIIHKASQQEEEVLVEDTSLEVEGAEVGVNIRWLLDGLDSYLGKEAKWILFLAYRKRDQIFLYKGEVLGTIVKPVSSEGFGFDPYFLPKGATKTLAEEKGDSVNARAHAVEAFISKKSHAVADAIYKWEGPWQGGV